MTLTNLFLKKSDTDYSIFTETGIPGLDIAFYAPRSHYHTPLDNLANTTPEALQHMGQLALAAVKGIANSDDMLDTPKEQESFIYFDILGRFMFAYSMTTFQIINILALLAVPGLSIYMSMRDNQDKTLSEVLSEKFRLTAHGLLAVFSALILMILVTVIAVYGMSLINPSMTYGDVYGAAIYCFVSTFLGLQLSQLILPNKIKQSLASTDATWYGLMAFWWIFVAFSSFAGQKGVAGLCFAVYILAFNSSSVLLHVLLPSTQKFRSPFIFFLQTMVPFVFLLEIDLLVMDAMRHATADGTPEIAGKIFIFILIYSY